MHVGVRRANKQPDRKYELARLEEGQDMNAKFGAVAKDVSNRTTRDACF